MSASSRYATIRTYNTLKANLSTVVGHLGSAQAGLAPVATTISSAYNVNEANTPIVGKIDALYSDIAETANYISTVIIPAIDNAIAHEESEIAIEEQA